MEKQLSSPSTNPKKVQFSQTKLANSMRALSCNGATNPLSHRLIITKSLMKGALVQDSPHSLSGTIEMGLEFTDCHLNVSQVQLTIDVRELSFGHWKKGTSGI